jgi:serine protease Do
MFARCVLFSACLVGTLCAASGNVRAQKPESDVPLDRVSPVVRVVQKCQGAVVAFINPQTGNAMGTGVIVDGRGLIVTNAHVVGNNKSLKLQLIDHSELVGDVLEVKGAYDLAVVKINTSKKFDILCPCQSDKVYVGEDVVAIGHPYGYSYSISRGILSATGRKINLPSGSDIEGVYQTDAAINPGNSGGPLMNIAGELIGINFAVRNGAQNIAFTIPVSKVREVLVIYGK